MAEFMYGSICLSNVPKRLFKKVTCKDGQERVYLNIKVVKRKEPSKFGNTHFISCEPKDENERRKDENYICGDLTACPTKSNEPKPSAPSFTATSDDESLPF